MEVEGQDPEQRSEKTADEEQCYDLLIIGAGPAGLTAAVYAARKKLETLMVSINVGGQTLLAAGVETYMGFQYVSGAELVQKFEEQVRQFPLAFAIGEEVTDLIAEDQQFAVRTSGGKRFTSKTVIIASGRRARALDVPGEKALIGRGVSYCATCDAPLFRDKDVAVIGSGNPALTAVNELSSYAHRVYSVVRNKVKADPVLVDRAKRTGRVEFLAGYAVHEIRGTNRVEGLVLRRLEDDEVVDLPLGGVFVEIGAMPNSDFARELIQLNERKEIEVDCDCKTSVPGIFAAGDVTNAPEKQIIVAAGEGAKAALSAYRYFVMLHQE